MRKKIVAGNWKMYKKNQEALQTASEIIHMANDEIKSDVEMILCAPFLHLSAMTKLSAGSRIKIGAQNCHFAKEGAFTGEISADMLADLAVEYVIIGHSERREYFQENTELLIKKIQAVLNQGLTPIFCCGEKLDIREANHHINFVKNQIRDVLFTFDSASMKKIVIAYEPVWAIGTGKTASADQAQEMHAAIRETLKEKFGDLSQSISILYGGSVKPENAAELFSCHDVDGGLVGGASLQSRSFIDIAKAVQ